jgi:hypothetical protein
MFDVTGDARRTRPAGSKAFPVPDVAGAAIDDRSTPSPEGNPCALHSDKELLLLM